VKKLFNLCSLVKDGKAPAGTVTVLARSGIVVVVRKGAPSPTSRRQTP
jgi:hypothetical protein